MLREQLGIELKRNIKFIVILTGARFICNRCKKNEFSLNSRTEFGDVIQLVQSIKEFLQRSDALCYIEFKKVDLAVQIAPKEPFTIT